MSNKEDTPDVALIVRGGYTEISLDQIIEEARAKHEEDEEEE